MFVERMKHTGTQTCFPKNSEQRMVGVCLADPPRYRTAYACEGSQLHIACDDGHLVQLIRANYGRFSISICNEHGTLDWSVDCMSHRSFRVMQQRYPSFTSTRCSVDSRSAPGEQNRIF